MPEDLEPILSLFVKKDNVYALYRYHCLYVNSVFNVG